MGCAIMTVFERVLEEYKIGRYRYIYSVNDTTGVDASKVLTDD